MCLAVGVLLVGTASAEPLSMQALLSRASLRAHIMSMLQNTNEAPTIEARSAVGDEARYFSRRLNDVNLGFSADEADVNAYAGVVFSTLEEFSSVAGLHVTKNAHANVLVVMDADPASRLLRTLTPRAQSALAESLDQQSVSFEELRDSLSCVALPQISNSGEIKVVYMLVKIGGPSHLLPECIAGIAPVVFGLNSVTGGVRDESYRGTAKLTLDLLSIQLLYSIPDFAQKGGAVGVSEREIDRALDEFYEAIGSKQ